ncbi:MAG: aminotransferase class V-fold PLP-dependent enzyme [Solobacterium sp.]|nr:aminotransferase class V-fold PLP-dependent enzyme [Solobacterium sp.]
MSAKDINWRELRTREFPVLETMTFLDAACVSFAPQRAINAVKAFADMTGVQDEENSSAHHIAMDSLRGKDYEEAQKLFNADPEEIALIESTSHGLNIAAAGIELNDGDSIITTNLEFIQVALPWCLMRKTKNIDIRVCKTEDNRFRASDFAKLADETTKILVMSTVEWCNGWASDLKEIGDWCQANNIMFVVDAVQQMGVTKIDTKQCHIDLLAAGGHKWANSPYGTGILYVNKGSLDKIKQSYGGYLNTTVPEGGWGAYWEKVDAQAVYDWTFPNTARKYEIGGTSNYAGAIALGESLGLVNEIGIENIQEHVWELGEYCMDQIEAIGGTCITHRDPERRAGIIIARLYKDPEFDRMIMRELHAKNIFVAQRFTDSVGGFRISCQWFNVKEDIDAMIKGMKDIIALVGREPDYNK